MKTRLLFVCLALIFSGSQVFAQLSKAEKKEWKKKAKEYSKKPDEFKQFSEAKQTAEATVSKQNADIKALQSTVSDKNAKIAELEDQITRMRGDLTSAQTELAQLKANPPVNPMDFSKGVVYKVQIGAFKNKDLSKYFDNNPNLGGEAAKDPEGSQRITIGIFRDYWDADTFKKYMRDMGVKDAWIVPYRDGQRVEIKDVMDQVTADKAKPATKK
jgi:outer membrane murein-binding lipoprotein Lpp